MDRDKHKERIERDRERGIKMGGDRQIGRQAGRQVEIIDNHKFHETSYKLRCVEFCFM